MEYSEKWGKDVDEAVRLALTDLGLTEDQVMVTVLEEPTKGFLGLGGKLAKVRVEKIQTEDEDIDDIPSGNLIDPGRKVARDLRKKNRPQQASGQGGGKHDGGRGGKSGGGRDRDNNKRDRGDHGSRNKGRENFGKTEEEVIDFDLSNKPVLSEKPADLVEVENNEASNFLKDLMENMKLTVDMKFYENDDCVYVEVLGEDAKTVIGKRGQTLDSIQYLTNLVSNKGREEYKRVIIDVEGYRSRREKTLESLAAKLASKAKRTGRSVKLEPMNPYERKVIHSTLQEISGVTTRSEGEEPYRRVVIEIERGQ